MGADRFNPMTGLPMGIKPKGVSSDERAKVAICRAKWEAAATLWKTRKARCDENRRMLAGGRVDTASADYRALVMSQNAAYSEPATPAPGESTEINLFLRTQMGLKAQAADPNWRAECSTRGDIPDEKIEDIETFHERLGGEAEVPREFSDALDDGGTMGVMVIQYGIDQYIDRKKMEGSAMPMADMILAVANGVTDDDGEPIKPKPGMDFIALADATRAFLADETQMVERTIEQQEALMNFAAAADQMWVDEMEAAPSGYEYGTIRARRYVYGDDVLWSTRMTTRWQDADWVAFRKCFTLDEAKAIDSWKPSARARLVGVSPSVADGAVMIGSPEFDDGMNEAINKVVHVIEFWDKSTGEVHYFTEASEKTGYEGFLERDSRYPYFDAKGRSIFKDWFPMRACTPVVHNIRRPERCFGMAWLENGKANARRYNLFKQAQLEARKRAGRVCEVDEDLVDDLRPFLERGDLTIVPRPAMTPEGKPLFFIHDFGECPTDFDKGVNDSLMDYAADVDMSVEEISGVSIAPTLGQSEKASAGSASRRGGLIRKLEAFAGEILRDIGQLAKRYYTDEKVTELMGPAFTKREILMDDAGMPVMDPKTGKPAEIPSSWDLFKASSPAGDFVTVTFSTRNDDLMRAKSTDDFLALAATPAGMDLATGFPMWDMRPQWERAAKARNMGRLKPFTPPPMMPAGDAGGGKPPGADEPDPSGRGARGTRGAPPVPGRQSRGEGPSDVGDHSTKAHRVGLS